MVCWRLSTTRQRWLSIPDVKQSRNQQNKSMRSKIFCDPVMRSFGYYAVLADDASFGPVGDSPGTQVPQDSRCNGRGDPPSLALGMRGNAFFGPPSDPTPLKYTRSYGAAQRKRRREQRLLKNAAREQDTHAQNLKKSLKKISEAGPYYSDPMDHVLGWLPSENRLSPAPLPIDGGSQVEGSPKAREEDRESPEEEDGPEELFECQNKSFLMGKARGVLRHLRKYHGIRSTALPPGGPDCLSFRKTIRDQLPCNLTLVQELSVKTVSKLVRRGCVFCQKQIENVTENYINERFTPVEVDERKLKLFKRALSLNVDQGWNLAEEPYIPNGHCSLGASRKQGGNWNEEDFATHCNVMPILSQGKVRVVTVYSSRNSEILSPLHRALFGTLRRKGWLLVGPPTDSKVTDLNGRGPLLSYDYRAATDNIKAKYVEAAVEVLLEKSEGLTDEQVASLRVVCELRFAADGPVAFRGQPMGSLMSFPLLCLINKTVVDLALTTLLESKKVTFKEWTSHRCLINGDDLLLRSPVEDYKEYDSSHRLWGDEVGLIVNEEKTMVSSEEGEINSTLFAKGTVVKKTNLSALYMSNCTDDVVGVAYEAASSVAEFRRFVALNARKLAYQEEKFPSSVPPAYRIALLSNKKIRRALRCRPSSNRPAEQGTLPMAEKPEGYDLSRSEECIAIREAVRRARDLRLWESKVQPPAKVEVALIEDKANDLSFVYRPRQRKPERELILGCCAQFWERKRKQHLFVAECESLDPPSQIVSDDTRIGAMLDCLRAWKSARTHNQPHSAARLTMTGADGHPSEDFLEFV